LDVSVNNPQRTYHSRLWNDYENYLSLRVSKATASNLLRYAKNYFYILEANDASELNLLTQEKRIHVMKALSSMSNFLGIHDNWKKLIERHDLKWTNNQASNNVFFKIFDNSSEDINKMIGWLKAALSVLPDRYGNILLFAALTGLRPTECWESIKMIQTDYENYVDKDKLLLQHFKYHSIFLRRTKMAYVSLVSDKILDMAKCSDIGISYAKLRKLLKSKKIQMNMYYCRKIFATFLRNNGIEPEIVDLLQGRISKSIFLRHYYRPDIMR
jgi:intergrase/recombinase